MERDWAGESRVFAADMPSPTKKRLAATERVLVTVLTKRLAEDLTEYLDEHGVRVRYLHSDVDTVERVEIIRVCTGDKAIVRRIVRGGVKYPVKLEQARMLIKLIFRLAAFGNFDNDHKILRINPRGIDIMPYIHICVIPSHNILELL